MTSKSNAARRGGRRTKVRHAGEVAKESGQLAPMYAVSGLAEYWRVSRDKVLTFIHSGQLHAINLATKPNGRPRYRIPLSAIEEFEMIRAVQRQPPSRRSKRHRDPEIIEFF